MPDDDGAAAAEVPPFAAVTRRLDPAMVVVTAADGAERDGCLVGFHAQVGIHPWRYAVWLSVQNRTHDLAGRASHLAVHALGAGDHDLAERFGGETQDDPGVDKLADLAWRPGPGGVPLIDALPDRFVGRVLARLDAPGADHTGFVLEPLDEPARGGSAAGSPAGRSAGPAAVLRLHDVTDIDPGHPA